MNVQSIVLAAVLAAIAPGQVSGALQVFFDMDVDSVAGKLAASGGAQSGNVVASIINTSVGFESQIDPLVAGTSDNIPPSFSSPTNRALGLFRVGTAYADGEFGMEDFDFSNKSGVILSFAYQGGESFTWIDDLDVAYRVGSGSWQNLAVSESFDSGWEIASIAIPSAVNNQTDVDLKIESISWVSVSNFLDIDNIQVTAIPEPRATVIAAGILVLGIVVSRRRRR